MDPGNGVEMDLDAPLDRAALPEVTAIPRGLAWFPMATLPTLHWDDGTPVPPGVVKGWLIKAHGLKSSEADPLVRLYCHQMPAREGLGLYVFRAWLERDTAGSAHKDRGLLAVVAACGGPEIALASERYLKQWYGHRVKQCKSLLAMLASTGEARAVQLVLGVPQRFRAKGLRQEAERLAHEVGERRGWTPAELADRMVPTAGLEADGSLHDEVGTVIARVRPDFTLDTSSADQLVTACKKELKSIANQQHQRLHEAMLTQRGWSFEDWQLYVWGHPLLRLCCQRLVWLVEGRTFRPLSDGTLVDAHNHDVAPAAEARVTLAHEALVSEGDWLQHLADHDVGALFPQFGRRRYAPVEERVVGEFRGYVLPAFTLRKLATAAGWMRGETERKGCFFSYVKSFPELELEARLGFTGNRLPEENRSVALTELSFGRPLAEVPPVVLSECYHDLAGWAAAGTGFDPQWQALGA